MRTDAAGRYSLQRLFHLRRREESPIAREFLVTRALNLKFPDRGKLKISWCCDDLQTELSSPKFSPLQTAVLLLLARVIGPCSQARHQLED